MEKKIKILVIDDSHLARESLKKAFSTDEELSVIATANDPYEAVRELRKNVPDVITLDLHMPRMDGLTFLKKLMQQHPIPVVVISSLTQSGRETALRALEYGAAEVITKPRIVSNKDFNENSIKLCRSVKAASKANIRILKRHVDHNQAKNVDNVAAFHPDSSKVVIAMGASTGGTETIKKVLLGLPENTPGIVITQHMPAGFTNQFATRLNNELTLNVKEAESGDEVIPGRVLIAPGDKHMYLVKSGGKFRVEVKAGELVNRHMPSVDELFDSVAKVAKDHAIGVLMTGMGKDGAKGLLHMKKSGAITIAQDEASCVVFGMPKEAIRMGATDFVTPLNEIPGKIKEQVEKKIKVK